MFSFIKGVFETGFPKGKSGNWNDENGRRAAAKNVNIITFCWNFCNGVICIRLNSGQDVVNDSRASFGRIWRHYWFDESVYRTLWLLRNYGENGTISLLSIWNQEKCNSDTYMYIKFSYKRGAQEYVMSFFGETVGI